MHRVFFYHLSFLCLCRTSLNEQTRPDILVDIRTMWINQQQTKNASGAISKVPQSREITLRRDHSKLRKLVRIQKRSTQVKNLIKSGTQPSFAECDACYVDPCRIVTVNDKTMNAKQQIECKKQEVTRSESQIPITK